MTMSLQPEKTTAPHVAVPLPLLVLPTEVTARPSLITAEATRALMPGMATTTTTATQIPPDSRVLITASITGQLTAAQQQ